MCLNQMFVKMSVGQMSVSQMSASQISVGQTSVGKMSVGKMSFEMSVSKKYVGQIVRNDIQKKRNIFS
jgi:hypothetical protein